MVAKLERNLEDKQLQVLENKVLRTNIRAETKRDDRRIEETA